MSNGFWIFDVIPVDDEREHLVDVGVCHCNPRVDHDHVNENIYVYHNAYDCREIVEDACELLGALLPDDWSGWVIWMNGDPVKMRWPST